MRFGFRATFVVSLSLLAVIACVGGDNQCLNPQPDLPSCRGIKGSGAPGGSSGIPNGSGDNGNDPNPSTPAAAAGSGGSAPGLEIGMDASAPASDAGASGELAGAGGDSAIESRAGAGAGGAAGSDDAP